MTHSMQCENYRNFLFLRIFGKNFVKVTVLLIKKLLNRWFDEIFFSVRVNFSFFNTAVCDRTYLLSHFFGKNFVRPTFSLRINLKQLLISWFHEIFLWLVERISRFSLYVHMGVTLHSIVNYRNNKNYVPQMFWKISWNQLI